MSAPTPPSEPSFDPSAEAGSASGEPGPGDGSSFRNLINALVSPREAFSSIARQPTTALALLLLVGLGIVMLHVAMSRVTPESFFSAIEASGRELPPQARDDPEKFLRIALWTQTVGALVLGPAFYFAVAGIALVLFRLLGSELTFRKSLSTTLHGMMPLGIAALVGLAVTLGRDEISLEELQSGQLVASHLGVLAGEETGKLMRAFLSSFDLFSIWCVALLATGYRIVARVSAGAAWGVVFSLWAAGVLAKLATTAAFAP